MSIFDACVKYAERGIPLVILAGKEYGSGSSRDWAAKGPKLLGIRAVIAESYERIHRSNLVGMGILPLQFLAGQECGVARPHRRGDLRHPWRPRACSTRSSPTAAPSQSSPTAARRQEKAIEARIRIDTPQEILYYQHGGILQYVLRQLAAK